MGLVPGDKFLLLPQTAHNLLTRRELVGIDKF